MAADSWSVVASVHEPTPLLCAMVAHYRNLGAERITLCLDDPADPARDRLAGVERVTLIPCDDAWWGGPRPPHHGQRQRLNATRVYRDCRTDWLLHVDADEYLCPPPGATVGEVLAEAGADWPVARIRPVERVRLRGAPDTGLFDGAFRVPGKLPEAERAALHGPHAPFFGPGGLLGHVAGKSFTRTGFDLDISVHGPLPNDIGFESVAQEAAWLAEVAVELPLPLAHYDGMTPLHWLLKLLRQGEYAPRRRMGLPRHGLRHVIPRDRQTTAVYRARQDPAALAALTDALLFLAPEPAATLEAQGLLRTLPLDPAATALADFPDLADALTTSRFDATLREDWRDLIRTTGFAG